MEGFQHQTRCSNMPFHMMAELFAPDSVLREKLITLVVSRREH